MPNATEYDYLRDEAAKRLVDRLNDIARAFPVAVDLGAGPGAVLKALIAEANGDGSLPAGIKTLHMVEESQGMLQRDEVAWSQLAAASSLHVVPHCAPVEGSRLPFADGSVDLVMSSCALHWVNDIPAVLNEIKRILKPDGVFLGAMLGGDTLHELRSSFVLAEQERDGGVSPHTSPMIMLADAGNLLAAAGFGIPTVDTDVFTVEYPDAGVLFDHLQGMGESNAAVGMRGGARRDTLLAAAAAYHALHGKADGSVPVTWQVVYMIGWAPAPTQPLPKARGSVPKGFGARVPAAAPAGSGAATSKQ